MSAGVKKAQDELASQGKELERTKERLGKLRWKNMGLERAAQASKDSAEHYKGLYKQRRYRRVEAYDAIF